MHKMTIGTDYSNVSVPNEMLDEDMEYAIESNFRQGESLGEGISGLKSIDTLFDNVAEEMVEMPRSGRKDVPIGGIMPAHEGVDNPAPVQTNEYEHPHRR